MGTRDRMWRAALPALLALACVVSARGHTQGEVQRAVVKHLHADDTEVAQNVIDALERRLLDVRLAKRDRRELGESATAGKLSKGIIRIIGMLVSQEIKAQCFPEKKQPIVVSTVVKGDRTYISPENGKEKKANEKTQAAEKKANEKRQEAQAAAKKANEKGQKGQAAEQMQAMTMKVTHAGTTAKGTHPFIERGAIEVNSESNGVLRSDKALYIKLPHETVKGA